MCAHKFHIDVSNLSWAISKTTYCLLIVDSLSGKAMLLRIRSNLCQRFILISQLTISMKIKLRIRIWSNLWQLIISNLVVFLVASRVEPFPVFTNHLTYLSSLTPLICNNTCSAILLISHNFLFWSHIFMFSFYKLLTIDDILKRILALWNHLWKIHHRTILVTAHYWPAYKLSQEKKQTMLWWDKLITGDRQ